MILRIRMAIFLIVSVVTLFIGLADRSIVTVMFSLLFLLFAILCLIAVRSTQVDMKEFDFDHLKIMTDAKPKENTPNNPAYETDKSEADPALPAKS